MRRRLLIGWWWAVGVAVCLLPAGCQELPATMVMPPEMPVADTAQPPLWPTMMLNPDFVKPFQASNQRDWVPEQAKLATAEFHEHLVTLHNVRDARWKSETECDLAYYDKTYDLDKLAAVDFIVVPFNETPSLGHTMLSFGFDNDDYVAVSVEIRKERGENFNPAGGLFQKYELIYVVADERDVIQRRVNCDLSDVYLYRSTATRKQARALFTDVMHRVNKLAREPEFYDTLTNNCTTNIRNHINRLSPGGVPYDYRVLLPGYSDRLAYDLELVERHGSYEETRLHALVNYQAYLYRDDPAFSAQIRR